MPRPSVRQPQLGTSSVEARSRVRSAVQGLPRFRETSTDRALPECVAADALQQPRPEPVPRPPIGESPRAASPTTKATTSPGAGRPMPLPARTRDTRLPRKALACEKLDTLG